MAVDQVPITGQTALVDQDRANLISNIVGHLSAAQQRLQLRQTALFFKADKEYGTRVAKGLGPDVAEVEKLAGLTQEERVKSTSE